jgi:hypothetical protein
LKKFDALISSYLYTNKKVDIEGIGSFKLDDSFVLPPDAEKSAFFPLEGIDFQYNGRAETTPGLIDFIMQHTGKIRSLTTADFSSYVSEIRQFVNIGKAWVIEGIGTLQKTREGKFELIPGEVLSERINMHYSDGEETSEAPVQRKKWLLGVLFTLAILAVVAGLGFGVYVLFIKSQDNGSAQQVQTDTSGNTQDTVSKRPEVITPPANDTPNYKVIFETTKLRSRALARTEKLLLFGTTSYYDSTVIRDTLRYRLFIYKRMAPADTARLKDSLSLYFGRRVKFERTH